MHKIGNKYKIVVYVKIYCYLKCIKNKQTNKQTKIMKKNKQTIKQNRITQNKINFKI
jgi:hypothetical protein